jgi:nucleoside-diphosphate-sugar epimerase
MTKPLILVTGAGGFVGGWIAEALHLSGRMAVRAGIRSWSSAARIARFPIEIVTCDVMDKGSIEAAVSGVDAIIHCARGKADSNDVAIDGTRLLLEAAKRHGIPKLVLMSSVAVYGDADGLVQEDTEPVGAVTVYGGGKRVAEQVARGFASERLAVTVLRPTLIYGPFSDQWSIPYITRFVSGRWTALGDRGEGKCNLVYVGDLVRFCLYAIEHDLGPFSVFNANGPEVTTWNSYLERFNRALGLPPLRPSKAALAARVALRRPLRRLGKHVLAHHRELLIAMANRSARLKEMMRRTEYDLRIMPNDDEIRRFSTDVVYSMAAANAAGFRPSTGVDEGLALTADWARRLGLVAPVAI